MVLGYTTFIVGTILQIMKLQYCTVQFDRTLPGQEMGFPYFRIHRVYPTEN